jgi:tRNA-specific 2-thiouridylase
MPSEANPRVIVGMSGGVDSSVAALLLLERGYEVEGLFMKNWEEDDTEAYCAAAEDLNDAQQVCDRLGIPLHRVNFAAEYWDRVFQYFLTEYRAGRTPNPDVMCNKEIKFRAFLDYAMGLGAHCIATGHYVRADTFGDRYRLLKGSDPLKDQSYFLYTLGQEQLAKSLFPLGELRKNEVRAIAKRADFENHRKKDSTGICFIGERNFSEFLQRYLPAQPGEMRTPEGDKIGTHRGLMFYTLGQRQGLGIGGVQGGGEEPWYVVGKDLDENILVVAQGHDHPLLYQRELGATELHWVAGSAPDLPCRCRAKTRYRQEDQACTIEADGGQGTRVIFDDAQWAITPGQSVVFYADEVCLGGGIIQTIG